MSVVYLVFVSRRYSNARSELKGVFDNPEAATVCHDYYNKGLEKQSPYKIEIRELPLRGEWNV